MAYVFLSSSLIYVCFPLLFFLSLQGSTLRSDPYSLGETLGPEPQFLELASRRSDRIPGFSPLSGSRDSLAFATVSRFLENGLLGPSVPEALGQQKVLTVSSTSAGQASIHHHGNPGDYSPSCMLLRGISEYCVAALLLRLWSGRQLLRWTRDHGSLLFGIQQSGPTWRSTVVCLHLIRDARRAS